MTNGTGIQGAGGVVSDTNSRVLEGSEPGRVIVLADVTASGSLLGLEVMRHRTDGGLEVMIVAPALVSAARFWASDVDAARDEAQERIDASVRALGFERTGWHGVVGDEDPLQALDDAVRDFPPDEIIIVTDEKGHRRWIEWGLAEQAAARYSVPVKPFVSAGLDNARPVALEGKGDRRRLGVPEAIVLAVAVCLAVMGTWGSFLLAGADVGRWALIAWVLVLDLGLKLIVLPLATWWAFFRRPPADRLDV